MTAPQILDQIKHLAATERLEIAEALLHQLRSEMKDGPESVSPKTHSRLARAARELLPDYSQQGELTAFTVLYNEPFHA
jgi:hypothetical protein